MAVIISVKNNCKYFELWNRWLIFGCAGLRIVSCGRDNVRLWRVRNGTLRSCPVNLGEYHSVDFTDVAFEEGNFSNHSHDDRTLWVGKPVTTLRSTRRNMNLIWIHWKGSFKKLDILPLWLLSTRYASSRSGHIFEIDYSRVVIRNVRRLLPAQQQHADRREKLTFNTGVFEINDFKCIMLCFIHFLVEGGKHIACEDIRVFLCGFVLGPGIAINSISVSSSFCCTGSEDGFLRLWPLDFSAVFLEAGRQRGAVE